MEKEAGLTPAVNQMIGPVEATETCVGFDLTRTRKLETDLGWYYQACTYTMCVKSYYTS